MKKIHAIVSMTLLLFNMSINAENALNNYQDVMYFRTVITDNPNDVRLSLCLKNTSFAVKSLQCTLVLPDGVSFVNNESGYAIEKSDIINEDWTLIARHRNGDQDNSAIILLYNASNAGQIETGDNIIASIPLNLNDADALTKGGVFIKDVTLTGADLKEYSGDSYALNIYTVTFQNDDNTILQIDTLEFGATPSYRGETPIKKPTSQYTYTFSSWSPEISVVTSDKTYTAVYDSLENLIYGDVNGDGTVDISDYIGVANRILGHTPDGFNEAAADVNDDGSIDISDYIGVANIILTGKP